MALKQERNGTTRMQYNEPLTEEQREEMRYYQDPYVIEYCEKKARWDALKLFRNARPENRKVSLRKQAQTFWTEFEETPPQNTTMADLESEPPVVATPSHNTSQHPDGHPSKRRFHVVDSGASYHLIQKSDLTEHEFTTLRQAKVVMPLQTANGIIPADVEADVFVPAINETVTNYVLKSTPECTIHGGFMRPTWMGLY